MERGRNQKTIGKLECDAHTHVMRTSLTCLATLAFALTAGARTASAQSSASRWKEIGKTATGNSVYVDPKTVKKANGIITARIRVKVAQPVATPTKGTWVQSHHTAMFDCAKQTVAAKESIYYGDAAATKVMDRSHIEQPGFGSPIGGSETRGALDYLCKS